MRVYGRKYEPIEADNEVFLSLIEESVVSEIRKVALRHPYSDAEQIERAKREYQKALIRESLIRLNGTEEYFEMEEDGRFDEDQGYKLGRRDYDDNGRTGTGMGMIHISNVIQKVVVELDESLEYYVDFEVGRKKVGHYTLYQLWLKNDDAVRASLRAIKNLTDEDVNYYYKEIKRAYKEWVLVAYEYEREVIDQNFQREVWYPLQSHLELIPEHKQKNPNGDFKIVFRPSK